MTIHSRLLLLLLCGGLVHCAHAARTESSRPQMAEARFVTGSHILQRTDARLDNAQSFAPLRVYSREQLASVGSLSDAGFALRELDPSISVGP